MSKVVGSPTLISGLLEYHSALRNEISSYENAGRSLKWKKKKRKQISRGYIVYDSNYKALEKAKLWRK